MKYVTVTEAHQLHNLNTQLFDFVSIQVLFMQHFFLFSSRYMGS